jgi:hypothetical protein
MIIAGRIPAEDLEVSSGGSKFSSRICSDAGSNTAAAPSAAVNPERKNLETLTEASCHQTVFKKIRAQEGYGILDCIPTASSGRPGEAVQNGVQLLIVGGPHGVLQRCQ